MRQGASHEDVYCRLGPIAFATRCGTRACCRSPRGRGRSCSAQLLSHFAAGELGGVYIGLNGGYGLGSSNWSNTLGSTATFATNGGVLGGTLGMNYAGFGDWVLLGLEGDFDWSGATGSAGCSVLGPTVLGAGATCQTRIDWLTTFRLRAGYLGFTSSFTRPPEARQVTFGSAVAPPALTTIQRPRSAGRQALGSNTSLTTRSAPSSNISIST